MNARVVSLKRHAGIAGQFSITVTAAYPDDAEQTTTTFVGSVYGSPGLVVMVLPSGTQSFVTAPERFGSKFGEQWVRNFVTGIEC